MDNSRQYLVTKITYKGPIRRMLCGHEFTPNFFADYRSKRHYRICKKCGTKRFVD